MRDFSLSRSLFQAQDAGTIKETLRQSLYDPRRQSTAVAILRGMLGGNSSLYLYDELHTAPLTRERIEKYRRFALELLCEEQIPLLRLLPELIARSQFDAAKDLYFSLAKYLPECAEVRPKTPLLLMLLSLYLADLGDLDALCCQASCRYGFALLFRTLYPACRCQSRPFELKIAETDPFGPDWQGLRNAIRTLRPYDKGALENLLGDWPPAAGREMIRKLQEAYEKVESVSAADRGGEEPRNITQMITRSETLPIK